MHTLDHELLRCFVAVAENGSFTSAGDKLGLTQPGVSVRIRKLEDRLQKPLFLREKRAISLTNDGEVLLQYARQMLNLNQEIIHYFNSPDMSGILNVGIADYVAHTTLQPLLLHFRKCFPKVKLKIVIGLGIDLLPKFEQGKLDVVVSGINETHLPSRTLYSEPLIWCAAHDWKKPEDGPIELLSLPEPCSHRQAGIDAMKTTHLNWEQTYTSSNISSIKAAISAGLGVAILPQSVIDDTIKILDDKDGFPPLPHNKIGAFLKSEDNLIANSFLDFYIDFRG